MIPNNIECECGRNGFVHCPVCGLRSVYALDDVSVTVKKDGLEKTLQGFRCSKCGCKFREGTVCTAPLTQHLREKREAAEDRSEQAKSARRAALSIVYKVNPVKAQELEESYKQQGLI